MRSFQKKRLSRRDFLRLSGLASAGAILSSYAPLSACWAASIPAASLTSPDEALQKLQEGNRRYVNFKLHHPNQTKQHRLEVARGQKPFAAIFGCVDSRVPPELVFDQGLGDLFVIRTAGQVLDNAALGSIEFGLEEFGIPLLMVLGHERCGAIAATIEDIEHNTAPHGRIAFLVQNLKPAVEKTKGQPGDWLDNAGRANVRFGLERLEASSTIVTSARQEGKLKVVGAYYDLHTGEVEITVP
jgi:carbonic anhydrase